LTKAARFPSPPAPPSQRRPPPRRVPDFTLNLRERRQRPNHSYQPQKSSTLKRPLSPEPEATRDSEAAPLFQGHGARPARRTRLLSPADTLTADRQVQEPRFLALPSSRNLEPTTGTEPVLFLAAAAGAETRGRSTRAHKSLRLAIQAPNTSRVTVSLDGTEAATVSFNGFSDVSTLVSDELFSKAKDSPGPDSGRPETAPTLVSGGGVDGRRRRACGSGQRAA
jgi:hypothetical protein